MEKISRSKLNYTNPNFIPKQYPKQNIWSLGSKFTCLPYKSSIEIIFDWSFQMSKIQLVQFARVFWWRKMNTTFLHWHSGSYNDLWVTLPDVASLIFLGYINSSYYISKWCLLIYFQSSWCVYSKFISIVYWFFYNGYYIVLLLKVGYYLSYYCGYLTWNSVYYCTAILVHI